MNRTPNPVTYCVEQQADADRQTLLLASARFITHYLRVPVQPDWGIVYGSCQCRDGGECARAGKHPSVSNPHERATFDWDTITGWVRAGRNLAAAPLRYLVVDVEGGAAKDGLTPLLRWAELAGLDPAELFDTMTVLSGGGGFHLWFWLPADGDPPRGMDGWLPDVDVKTEAKISDKATIPGSLHRSGRRYDIAANALGGQGFHWPRRAPQVLLDEVRAGRAWRYQPAADRAGLTSLTRSGAGVRFSDFMNASRLWRHAEILPPGAVRPPKSEFAGLALGSLTDGQRAWARNVTS